MFDIKKESIGPSNIVNPLPKSTVKIPNIIDILFKESNSSYFFNVITNPEGKELVINKEHKFFDKIESLDENSRNILFDILMSLNQTLSLYDGDQKISTDELIDDINYTWSKILSNYCSSNA